VGFEDDLRGPAGGAGGRQQAGRHARENIDYALLLDGLQAEREQGITIDVAYRFFSTDKRKFIVADTPGHEQYTRNMVTGASTAQVAVILIDARKGVLTQTRRHSYLVSLVGIRHVVLAVNKMDLVDYHTPWYAGATLMTYLETVQVDDAAINLPFRLPVQWVNRPDLNFRGFAGTLTSGRIRPGDAVTVAASGKSSRVSRIVTMDGDLAEAIAGQAVTLTLADEIDISRGDVLSDPQARPAYADQFEARVVWLHEEPLLPGRSYLLKCGTTTVPAQVSLLKHKVNVNTLQHEPGRTLELNEVGVCNLALGRAIAFDPYRANRATGSFILVDRISNATVGAGMIDTALQRAVGHWPTIDLDQPARAGQKGQQARVLWFTGRPGAGKSTIANLVEKKLYCLGRHTYILDGDSVRQGLNRDLGYAAPDQVEHIRRLAEVAKILSEAGLIVLVAALAPFRSERRAARELFAAEEFVEIFVDTPPAVCEQRESDLYRRVRAGEFGPVSGLDATYEPPEAAEITIDGSTGSPAELAERIVAELYGGGRLEADKLLGAGI
jgi:bifunctional enzyme CysN/CysC